MFPGLAVATRTVVELSHFVLPVSKPQWASQTPAASVSMRSEAFWQPDFLQNPIGKFSKIPEPLRLIRLELCGLGNPASRRPSFGASSQAGCPFCGQCPVQLWASCAVEFLSTAALSHSPSRYLPRVHPAPPGFGPLSARTQRPVILKQRPHPLLRRLLSPEQHLGLLFACRGTQSRQNFRKYKVKDKSRRPRNNQLIIHSYFPPSLFCAYLFRPYFFKNLHHIYTSGFCFVLFCF